MARDGIVMDMAGDVLDDFEASRVDDGDALQVLLHAVVQLTQRMAGGDRDREEAMLDDAVKQVDVLICQYREETDGD